MISPETINDIKQKIPISEVIKNSVALKPMGQALGGLCPFHKEKTPSFYVRDNVARFKCFGCGASGDVFEFLMRLHGISFNEAINQVASLCGIMLDKSAPRAIPEEQLLLGIQKKSQEFFINCLASSKAAINAREYLIKKRGLSPRMVKEAFLGFGGGSAEEFFSWLKLHKIKEEEAKKAGVLKEGRFGLVPRFLGKITFPIRDFNGKLVAFGARSLDNEGDGPKYINTHSYTLYEKRKNLFGLFESKKAILEGKTLHLVEGYFDVLALWAIGKPAAALCGSSLTLEHVSLIKRLSNKVVLVFDTDNAGINALKNSLSLLFSENIKANTVSLKRKDPGAYLEEKALEELSAQIEKTQDAFCLLMDNIESSARVSIQDRLSKIDEILPIFKSIKRPIALRQYSNYLAKALHEDGGIIWQEIFGKIKKNLAKPLVKKESIKLNGVEQLLVRILAHYPQLLKDFILHAETCQTAGFIEFFNACKDQGLIKHQAQALSPGFLSAIELILREPIDITEEMAQVILQSVKERQDKLSTKTILNKKREELKKAQNNQDFLLMRQNLREQSQLLKVANKKIDIKNYEKNSEIKPLGEEWQMFDDDASWY